MGCRLKNLLDRFPVDQIRHVDFRAVMLVTNFGEFRFFWGEFAAFLVLAAKFVEQFSI